MEKEKERLGGGGGGSEYPSFMKMSGVAPQKGVGKKSQPTEFQLGPTLELENEERGETTETYTRVFA